MQLIGAPAFTAAAAVTPSDSTLINCRGIYVGGTGNLAISTSPSAAAVTLSAIPVGTFLPICLDQGRIMSTNTTATLIVAFQ